MLSRIGKNLARAIPEEPSEVDRHVIKVANAHTCDEILAIHIDSKTGRSCFFI